VNQKDRVGNPQGLVTVRRENDRVTLSGEFLQIGAEALGVERVQSRKRLVEKNQAGRSHQLGRDGDAAALAAREARYPLVLLGRNPQKFEQLLGAVFRFLCRIVPRKGNARGKPERFHHGEGISQKRLLRQVGDFLLHVLFSAVDSVKENGPALVPDFSREQFEKRTFPLSALSDDGKDFARGQKESDVLQNGLSGNFGGNVGHRDGKSHILLMQKKVPVPKLDKAPGKLERSPVFEIPCSPSRSVRKDELETFSVKSCRCEKSRTGRMQDCARFVIVCAAAENDGNFFGKRNRRDVFERPDMRKGKLRVFQRKPELLKPQNKNVAVLDFFCRNVFARKEGSRGFAQIRKDPGAVPKFDFGVAP
jgi:hypothetical protein